MESGPPSSPADGQTDHRNLSRDSGLASLLTAADMASFRLAADGTIIDVNDIFTSVSEYTRAELLEKPFSTILEDEMPTFESIVDDGDLPVSTTITLRTNSGTSLSATLYVASVADDSSAEIVGILDRPTTPAGSGSASSLTYGRTFEALAGSLPDGIIVLDAESTIQYANPAVERILGFSPDELVGSSKVTIIPPRLREDHLEALKRYLETGERHLNWTYVELPGQHAAGHEIPLGVSLNDFTYDGDRYFVGLFRDISPRKEAEQTLTTKVSQLETVSYLGRHALENTDIDALLEKASDLIATALAVDCCAIFEHEQGNADEPFTVRSYTGCSERLIDAERSQQSTDDVDSLTSAAITASEPVVVEHLEMDDRFADSTALAAADIESGVGVTIGRFDDPWGALTVYGSSPQEFANHDVDFLESVATVIASAIERQRYEQRLNETVADLEESNERLEQFAYAASHDLQEPLRMVSSYLQLLERRYADALDEDATEFIEYAVDGADRMREMIDGLLAYSRIDSQGEPFEPVNLEDVLEDVLTDLQVQIDQHDAEITATTLPVVRGDPRQLRQLFQNLLSNAIEYRGESPPRIHIDVECRADRWKLSVHDEGIGMDTEDTDRVFRVFQRLHSRDEFDGTGIGLALCRRIVERHGGEIWAESELGDGATFSFTLPAASTET